MTCANCQAFVRRRTLCQVLDHRPLSDRPTAAHLAAFILPSRGWSFSATLPLRHWCVSVRVSHICSVVHWRTISGSFAHGRISGGGKILRTQSTTGMVGDSFGGVASKRCDSHRVLSPPSAEQEHVRPLAQCAESAGICA